MPEQPDRDVKIDPLKPSEGELKEDSKKPISDFLFGRKLNLVKVAGLEKLDQHYYENMGFSSNGEFATGVNDGSSVDKCVARKLILSNYCPQAAQAARSSCNEHENLPECSGVQNDAVPGNSSEGPDESEKGDSSLDDEDDDDYYEDDEDEEVDFDESDEDSSVDEEVDEVRVPPINHPENENRVLPSNDERESTENVDSDSWDDEDTASSDAEDEDLGNGNVCDEHHTQTHQDRDLGSENAATFEQKSVEIEVARVHGEHLATEESDFGINGGNIRREIARGGEIRAEKADSEPQHIEEAEDVELEADIGDGGNMRNDLASFRETGPTIFQIEISNKEVRVEEINEGANTGEIQAGALDGGEILVDNGRIPSQEPHLGINALKMQIEELSDDGINHGRLETELGIDARVTVRGGSPTEDNGSEISIRKNFGAEGLSNGESRHNSQQSWSVAIEGDEEDDDFESDDFLTGDDCPTADGFQTADDDASETDSVGLFFDCEDDISVNDDIDSRPSREVGFEGRNLKGADEDHVVDESENFLTDGPAREANIPEEEVSSNDSGSFDDTVMEQTIFEAASKTPAMNSVAVVGNVSKVAFSEKYSFETEIASAEDDDEKAGERPRPAVTERDNPEVEEVHAEQIADVELLNGSLTVPDATGCSAGLSDGTGDNMSSQTTDNSSDAATEREQSSAIVGTPNWIAAVIVATAATTPDESSTNASSQGTANVDRASDEAFENAREAVKSDLVEQQPLEEQAAEKKPENDQVAENKVGEQAVEPLGVEAPQSEEVIERKISALQNLVEILSKGCDPSVANIMSSLPSEQQRNQPLSQKRSRVVKAIASCTPRRARIFLSMLKEHFLRIRYLLKTEGDSQYPVSAEVIRLVWDMTLADFTKLEAFIDHAAAQFASPIASVLSVAEIAERAVFDVSLNILQRMFKASLSASSK